MQSNKILKARINPLKLLHFEIQLFLRVAILIRIIKRVYVNTSRLYSDWEEYRRAVPRAPACFLSCHALTKSSKSTFARSRSRCHRKRFSPRTRWQSPSTLSATSEHSTRSFRSPMSRMLNSRLDSWLPLPCGIFSVHELYRRFCKTKSTSLTICRFCLLCNIIFKVSN